MRSENASCLAKFRSSADTFVRTSLEVVFNLLISVCPGGSRRLHDFGRLAISSKKRKINKSLKKKQKHKTFDSSDTLGYERQRCLRRTTCQRVEQQQSNNIIVAEMCIGFSKLDDNLLQNLK